MNLFSSPRPLLRPHTPDAQTHATALQMHAAIKLQLIGARQRLGLTKAEVAKKAGVTPVVIREIESFGGTHTIETILAVAAVLGLDISLKQTSR